MANSGLSEVIAIRSIQPATARLEGGMKLLWQSALSMFLGVLGGVVATLIVLRVHSGGWKPAISAGIVRATRFELVDSQQSSQPVAYWGRDWANHRIVIVFTGGNEKSRAEFGTEQTKSGDFTSASYSPFLEFAGSDGAVRLQERLDSSQEPILLMGDSGSEDRLLLGHIRTADAGNDQDLWNRWSLVIRGPSGGWRDYLDIGATTPVNQKNRTGYLIIRDSSGRQLTKLP